MQEEEESCKRQVLRALTAAMNGDQETMVDAVGELLVQGRNASVVALATWASPVAMNLQKGLKMDGLVIVQEEDGTPIYAADDPRTPTVVKAAFALVRGLSEDQSIEHVINAVNACYAENQELAVGELMMTTLNICGQVLSQVMGPVAVKTVCPWCMKEADGALGVSMTRPQPDEVALCASCLMPSVWGADGKLHKPEQDMTDQILTSEEYRSLRDALGKLGNPK